MPLCGRDRLVWFVITDEQEKGFRQITPRTLAPEPTEGFAGNNICSEPLDATDGVSIANKVPRIPMIGQAIVLRRKPMVKSMITRLRLTRQIEHPIEMPLAAMGR